MACENLFLRRQLALYRERGTPVTLGGLELIVRGALVALEAGNEETAKLLLAAYLAMSTEAKFGERCSRTLN